MQLVKTPDM